jgi:hypothetical protein
LNCLPWLLYFILFYGKFRLLNNLNPDAFNRIVADVEIDCYILENNRRFFDILIPISYGPHGLLQDDVPSATDSNFRSNRTRRLSLVSQAYHSLSMVDISCDPVVP